MIVQNSEARNTEEERHPPTFVGARPDLLAVPASAYSMNALADIYNQSRVDYIVPMPMNGIRLNAYVAAYDVDLDASLVVQSHAGQMLGISMLGLRDERAWITRLGVLPVSRRRGTGQFIMSHHLHTARRHGALQIQLEVIKGNDPAHNLFRKYGFLNARELLVIRRPPGAPQTNGETPTGLFAEMSAEAIQSVLAQRPDDTAWTEENATFHNITGIKGLRLESASGEVGHLIYQQSAFQFGHLVLCSAARRNLDLAAGLLFHLHQQNPLLDTKVENLATDDPLWPVFQQVGYVEVFRRIEMFHLIQNAPSGFSHH